MKGETLEFNPRPRVGSYGDILSQIRIVFNTKTMIKAKKRPDGRYEKKVTLHDGITGESYVKHVYAFTLPELQKAIADLKAKYDGLANRQYSVAAFIDYYMSARQEDSPETSTLSTYEHMIRNYITGTRFAALPMDSVNVPACRQFLSQFKPIGNTDGGRTKQMLYVLLHAIFKQAWKEKIIRENPWDFIDKPKHKAKERLTLTKDEFNRFIQATSSVQMRRIYQFARNTGMRRGEICALKVKDLYLDEGYIEIHKGIKLVNKKWVYGTLKTESSERIIAIPPIIVELLKEQLKFIGQKRSVTLESYVFQNRHGGFLEPLSLTRAFTDTRKELGLPKEMTFHSLRATVATYLAEHDVNPKKIQAKLGHSTVTMTLNKYVKHTPDMESGLVGLLQDM